MDRKTILFADDDKEFREFMRDAIRIIGGKIHVDFEVIEAIDGEEAVSLFNSHKIDFVVTDYKMPKATAVDVIRHIVNSNPVPIIVISGYKEAESVDFVAEGAIIFVRKPFELDHITKAFQNAIELISSPVDHEKAKRAIENLEKLLDRI